MYTYGGVLPHCSLYSLTGLLRRLKLFREQNEEDVTVLNYFDELEIHPKHISKYMYTIIIDMHCY